MYDESHHTLSFLQLDLVYPCNLSCSSIDMAPNTTPLADCVVYDALVHLTAEHLQGTAVYLRFAGAHSPRWGIPEKLGANDRV